MKIMKDVRLLSEYYELRVKELMDRRVWDLPIVGKKEGVYNILNILGARNHIWVVNNKEEKELVGVITEHDVLSLLAPKKIPSYIFGMPNLSSIKNGTTKTAEDIMCSKIIGCELDNKIVDILKKMTFYRLRRLPIVENKKIIGELTLHHLIRKYYHATQYYHILERKG
jgi:predicted transcriptional regulator